MSEDVNERPRIGMQVVISEPAEVGSTRGLVGRVLRDKGPSLSVILTDGRIVNITPDRVKAIRGGTDPDGSEVSPDDGSALVTEHTIYAAVVGPAALGPAGLGPGGEDLPPDVRAVYQAPTSALWSLTKPPTQVTGPSEGWLSWEVEQFCRQGLEADPECIELLWSARPVWSSEAGLELLDLRGAFLSARVAVAYATHVAARFKELDEAEPEQSDRRWAYAAHLLQLLMNGAALVRRGDTADLTADSHNRLIGIRAGEEEWSAVDAWRLELQKDLERAAATSFLPAKPDVTRVNAWLAHTRRRAIDSPTA